MKEIKNYKIEWSKIHSNLEIECNKISIFRMILFLLLIVMLVYINQTNITLLKIIVTIIIGVIFLVVALYHSKRKALRDRYQSYLKIISQYEDRITGTWKDFKEVGEDLTIHNKTVLEDLDIIGKNSLFQYLNIAKTHGGKQKLLDRLSNNKMKEKDLLLNQEAMKELVDHLKFCIEFQYEINKEDITNEDLNEKVNLLKIKTESHFLEMMIGIFLSSTTLILLLLSILGNVNIAYFLGMSCLMIISSMVYNMIYKDEFEIVKKIAKEYGGMLPLYLFLSKQNFHSKKLNILKDNIKDGLLAIKSLNKVYTYDTFRYNSISYIIINAILPLNIYVLYLFSKVKRNNITKLQASIESLEELEVLTSLSVIGVCKENICIPTQTQEISLNFKDIKHPLLDENDCVENLFSCLDNVIIITGSNMSGKTSFLRTIGVNLILMNAGGYVTAKSFSASSFKIFTSMRVKDDIERGISTFYGELLRIKEVMDYSEKNEPTIAFIDEIFKGTNYNDRMEGAKAIIKKLTRDNVILFITTHDFELCNIRNKKLVNYHFKEHYVDEEIHFDYKIRDGRCSTTNAQYLMRKLNIIDD